jgi:hypothetical protein
MCTLAFSYFDYISGQVAGFAKVDKAFAADAKTKLLFVLACIDANDPNSTSSADYDYLLACVQMRLSELIETFY